MFARNVATRAIAKAGFRILVDVPDASMTKVRPLAPCLTSASSRFCSLSISPSRSAQRRKECPLRNCPRNTNSARRPAGSLNGRYSRRCKALATIHLREKSMWTSTTLGSIGEHSRTQSSMCSFVEWYFMNRNAKNRAFRKCALSA